MKEAESELRPKFQLGEQARFAERYQRFLDHQQEIYDAVGYLKESIPGMTHVLFTSELCDGERYKTSLQGMENMFSKAEQSFRLEGITQGLDLGHDAFLRRCVAESQSHEGNPEL